MPSRVTRYVTKTLHIGSMVIPVWFPKVDMWLIGFGRSHWNKHVKINTPISAVITVSKIYSSVGRACADDRKKSQEQKSSILFYHEQIFQEETDCNTCQFLKTW